MRYEQVTPCLEQILTQKGLTLVLYKSKKTILGSEIISVRLKASM